jgi:hypothetical protein
VTEIGFAGRLAYVRWLLDRGRVMRLTDAEFAAWLGVGVKWLGKWKARTSAPKGMDEAEAIEVALGQHGWSRAWLYKGTGGAPVPDQWRGWLTELRESQRAATPPEGTKREDVDAARVEQRQQQSKKGVGKKAASGDRHGPKRRQGPQ